MDIKLAKDFLVQQVAEQAALEGVSLSDLEQRVMYFTESDPTSCEAAAKLEFAVQYEATIYEAKISTLLHHVHKRLKRESREKSAYWDLAIRSLKNGDHYLLDLWAIIPPGERDTRNRFSQIGLGLLIALVTAAAIVVWISLAYH